MSHIRYQFIFPGSITEQVHTEAMFRYKKVARNSQHGSTTDKLYGPSVLVICAGVTGWMDKVKVGEAADVTGFSMAFDIVSHMVQTGVVLPEQTDHNPAEKSSELGHEAQRIIMVNN